MLPNIVEEAQALDAGEGRLCRLQRGGLQRQPGDSLGEVDILQATSLEAAQASFTRIQGLSLFNYIR